METKFSPENCRLLCRKIKETTISKSLRAEMLREAFVWASAPEGKFFWHEQWVRLKNGREMTPKAIEIMTQIATEPKHSARRFTQLTNVINGVQLCRQFGLDY